MATSGETNQVLWRGVQPVAGIRGVWPALDSVRVMASAEQVDAGSAVVYTVPSGKILFISSMQVTHRLTFDNQTYGYAQLYDDENVEQNILGAYYYRIVGQDSGSQYWMPALEVPAGWKVKARAAANNLQVRVTIFGWLEDE